MDFLYKGSFEQMISYNSSIDVKYILNKEDNFFKN